MLLDLRYFKKTKKRTLIKQENFNRRKVSKALIIKVKCEYLTIEN